MNLNGKGNSWVSRLIGVFIGTFIATGAANIATNILDNKNLWDYLSKKKQVIKFCNSDENATDYFSNFSLYIIAICNTSDDTIKYLNIGIKSDQKIEYCDIQEKNTNHKEIRLNIDSSKFKGPYESTITLDSLNFTNGDSIWVLLCCKYYNKYWIDNMVATNKYGEQGDSLTCILATLRAPSKNNRYLFINLGWLLFGLGMLYVYLRERKNLEKHYQGLLNSMVQNPTKNGGKA